MPACNTCGKGDKDEDDRLNPCPDCYSWAGWKRCLVNDLYNDSWFPSKSRWMQTTYAKVNIPRHWRIPPFPGWLPDLYPFDNEQRMGSLPIQVACYRADNVCVDPGDRIDPPVYESDIYETLIVRPTVRYWGKGLH